MMALIQVEEEEGELYVANGFMGVLDREHGDLNPKTLNPKP